MVIVNLITYEGAASTEQLIMAIWKIYNVIKNIYFHFKFALPHAHSSIHIEAKSQEWIILTLVRFLEDNYYD